MGQGEVRGGRRQEEMQINYRQRVMGTGSNMDTHSQLQVRNSNASRVEHTPKSTSFQVLVSFLRQKKETQSLLYKLVAIFQITI